MRTFLIFVWLVYLVDISVLAVKDGDVGIGLSFELKSEIDNYVACVVSALTEKYENRITDLETELGLQKQRIAVLEARALADDVEVRDDQKVTVDHDADDVTVSKYHPQEREFHPDAAWPRTAGDLIRRDVEHQVAFFASLTNRLDNLGLNQDIAFDKVVTNIGNAYNGHHGTFLAPVAGTYVFHVTLLNPNTPQLYGHFMVNDNIVAKISVHEWHQTSQTVIVQLQPGDDVSVQIGAASESVGGDRYATFCGFLLYQDFTAGHVVE